MRLSSQCGATYEMTDSTRNVLDIPRTKNNDALLVPLNSDVLAAIRLLPSWLVRRGQTFRNQRHPGRPVLSNDHWFKPALKTAKVENSKWHDLRLKTYVCILADIGRRALGPRLEITGAQKPEHDDANTRIWLRIGYIEHRSRNEPKPSPEDMGIRAFRGVAQW